MIRPILSIVFVLLASLCQAQFRYTGRSFATRSEVIARNGMAATSQPLATQVALDVLKKGGTAVDAAIAANALLGLVEPTGNGIGGDIFAIIWDAKTQKLYGLNGSGRSPKTLSLDYFTDKNLTSVPKYGALSVSVPGCVAGWYTLHQKFGKVPMKDLLEPTIDYARQGYPVTEVIAFLWDEYAGTLSKYDNYRKLYMPNGRPPRKGEIFRNEDLAATLEQISKGGPKAFYEGEIARTISTAVKREGGFLSYEDLASHRSEWMDPVSTNYRGYDVWEMPPNGQGIAVLQMLNILEGYDLKKMGFGSTPYLHSLVEAKKLAFEDRSAYYADMDFYEAPLAKLLSKAYAQERRSLIDSLKAGIYTPGVMEGGSNTIYLTTADKEGNMVSLIQSNFAGMGSGIVPDGLGFSLQNRGSSFTLTPGKPNTFAPAKRPFHTLIPGFITKGGQPFVSFGVMGADVQPQGHVQIVTNLIDFGMNLQEAGDAPRISHVGSSGPSGEKAQGAGRVRLENGFSPEVILQLMKMGHDVGYDLRGYGGYQAIMYDPIQKVYYGASESRKDGQAAGF